MSAPPKTYVATKPPAECVALTRFYEELVYFLAKRAALAQPNVLGGICVIVKLVNI